MATTSAIRTYVPWMLFCSCAVLLLKRTPRDDASFNSADVQPPRDNSSSRVEPNPAASHRDLIDLSKELSFLPYDSRNCSSFNSTGFVWPEGYSKATEEHQKAIDGNWKLEGHSGEGSKLVQQMVYVKLAQLPFVNTICETGFNAGHSTLIWLASKANTRVYSFDLGDHVYAKYMADYLKTKHPGRLTVTWGDTMKTLPAFAKEHPEVQCDLIIVDGGHTFKVAAHDIETFHKMANSRNVLVFDDHPSKFGWSKNAGRAWELQIRRGITSELFGCQMSVGGFSLGRFLF
ncbi:hypothetical protein CAPTEDRAFT_205468 [Capitella teleta]|uniref:Methyltransferase domain-containing protein n=1 Tax=Capitella teleta TaxID=283909 RepID=R7UGR8_CAPTE|nr:hypothetical protein CAPTEDRAFT_205468 [Capitella teleta]|eukprot:ELU05415.1 hypothetical protein CAPTEDRAFT_205468 [Capitella teleta]